MKVLVAHKGYRHSGGEDAAGTSEDACHASCFRSQSQLQRMKHQDVDASIENLPDGRR
jgi:hypothetical protein